MCGLRHDESVQTVSDGPRPTSIRLFLADGRADGLRLVEKSNWTGLAMVCSRSDYLRVRKRDEWTRPGVYLLSGPADDETGRPLLYVGEADNVRDRVDSHVKNKEFWTTVIAFTSKDENLNKAHVRYLEARLLQLASAANRVAVQNSTAPPAPRLSEADQADMEGYLAEMLVILPLLSVVAFEPLDRAAPASERLVLSGKEASASGAETSDGFVVFEGSLARPATVPSLPGYVAALRGQLIKDGVLVQEGERLRFTQPHLFDSPSSAAAVVLGRNANGRVEWKEASGRTLKDRQSQAVQDH
jgi:hypothetical protein